MLIDYPKKDLWRFILSISLFLVVYNGRGEAQQSDTDYSWNFSSRILTNESIEEMIDSVSAEILLANVDTLANFYTRNTASDTVSPAIGIGAARRWIHGKFESYANDTLTYDLEPSYYSFNASVCGIPREQRNVLATVPGAITPDRIFLVMGHMDSRTTSSCNYTSYAPGANDDGSGTVVAMEIARVISRYPLESTVILMAVTGEEQGLYGSSAYAQYAQSQGLDIEAAITNDVVGNIEGCVDPSCPPGDSVIIDSTSVRHFSGTPETGISRQLTRYMKLKGMEYLQGFTVNLIPSLDRPGRSGDHVPFYNRGYAAARFSEPHENGDGSGNNGRQHNPYDTVSYYNTNAGYMANIARLNIAGIASLALAPTSPSGLQAEDAGNGTSAILTWPDTNNEPDFAGYRIAVRPQGELFYSDVVDAGDVHEFTVDSLTENQLYYLSISAYDMDDNESVFSPEISFTPSGTPLAPAGFETTSQPSSIRLSWIPNSEIDMASYRVYRRAPGQPDPILIATMPHPESTWFDNTLQPHVLYEYNITAVDSSQNESPFSETGLGQLATHDLGVLLIDGTLDGSGGPLQPTDEEVDGYYSTLVNGFNIGGSWDIADSQQVDTDLYDAHLSSYSVAFYYSDRVNASHVQDTTALKKYLENGGNLLLTGWNLAASIGGVIEDFHTFPHGSFFREYLLIDSLGISPPSNQDFISAPSLIPLEYPDLTIDSAKVSFFNHQLFKMDAFLSPLVGEPTTERIFIYNSSLGGGFRLHGEPVGFRHIDDDLKVIVIDVPLYFINQQPAVLIVRQALTDLGEEYTAIDNDYKYPLPESNRILSCYPNPFNSSAAIEYQITEKSRVQLSIYNLLGQQVNVVVNEISRPGKYRAVWNASDYPSGVYFARLSVGNYSSSIRLLLLK